MSQPASPRQIEAFRQMLDSTAAWLERHFGGGNPNVAEQARALAQKLVRYLDHCRRHARVGEMTLEELDRRRGKIEAACFALWQATRSRS